MGRLIVAAAVAIALALPAWGSAFALPSSFGMDAPMHFVSDAMLAADPRVTGAGTASDPFVIEGFTFAFPTQSYFAGASLPLVMLEDIRGHVVVRGNTFQHASSGTTTMSIGLLVTNSVNVVIEGNTFSQVGSYSSPALSVESSNVVVSANQFASAFPFSIKGSTVRMKDNVVHDFGFAADSVIHSVSRSIVERNQFAHGLDVKALNGELDVIGNQLGALDVNALSGRILVKGNTIQGDTYWRGPAVARDNAITDCWDCIQFERDNVVDLDTSNLVNGYPALLLWGLTGTHVTSATPLGWIGGGNLVDVTLSGIDYRGEYYVDFYPVDNLTIQDSHFEGYLGIYDAEGTTTLTGLTLGDDLDVFVDQGALVARDIVGENVWFFVDEGDVDVARLTLEEFAWIDQYGCGSGLAVDVKITHPDWAEFEYDYNCGDPGTGPRVKGLSIPATGYVFFGGDVVDARDSWWGSPHGPDLAGRDSDGVYVSTWAVGTFLFDPWLRVEP